MDAPSTPHPCYCLDTSMNNGSNIGAGVSIPMCLFYLELYIFGSIPLISQAFQIDSHVRKKKEKRGM